MIDKEWPLVKLGQVVQFFNGSDYTHYEVNPGYKGEAYPVYGSGGEFAKCKKYVYDGESVLLGRKGTIDKPFLVKGKFWIVDTVFRTITNPLKLDTKYFYYLAQTFPYKYLGSSTALPSMTQTALKNWKILLPSLIEQKNIVSLLDAVVEKVDANIEQMEAIISLLQEKRQALIAEAIMHGVPGKKYTFVDTNLLWFTSIPNDWKISKLGHYLAANDGGAWGNDPNGQIDHFVFRSTEQSQDGNWKIENPALRSLTEKEFSKTQLKENDLLMTKSSGSPDHIGKTTIVTKEINDYQAGYSNFMQRLTTTKDLIPLFAWYILNSKIVKNQINFYSKSTSGLANINAKMISEFKIIVPPLKDQDDIISYLGQRTKEIEELTYFMRSTIELLKEKRAALINDAVTGKLVVS